jgi:hypothetical protein
MLSNSDNLVAFAHFCGGQAPYPTGAELIDNIALLRRLSASAATGKVPTIT